MAGTVTEWDWGWGSGGGWLSGLESMSQIVHDEAGAVDARASVGRQPETGGLARLRDESSGPMSAARVGFTGLEDLALHALLDAAATSLTAIVKR